MTATGTPPRTPERQALAHAIARHDALIERLAAIKDHLVTTPIENRYLIETKHDEIVALADNARTERFRCVDVVVASEVPIEITLLGWRRSARKEKRLRAAVYDVLQAHHALQDAVGIDPSAAVDAWEKFRRALATDADAPAPD